MAKMETDWFDKSYDVIFTNGDKLEFDKKGVWTEVNCKYSAVPVAVVPEAIKKYVATNYPDAKMLKIERDNHEETACLFIDFNSIVILPTRSCNR